MKTKKFKKLFLITVTIFTLIICIGAIIIYKMSQMPPPVIYTIEDIDFSNIPNGTYVGYADNGLVKVKVSVAVVNGMVTDITILEHDNGLGRKAEAITVDVINAQSLDVDTISSATYSSTTILKAIENALIQGIME